MAIPNLSTARRKSHRLGFARAIVCSPRSWFALGFSVLLLSWMKMSPYSSLQTTTTGKRPKQAVPQPPQQLRQRDGKTNHAPKPKQRSRRQRHGLDPADEQSFDHDDLKRYFGCNKLFKTPRPVITDDEWRNFRDLYNEFVDAEYSSSQYPNGPETYKVGKSWSGSPVHGNTTPDKGRGLAASRDIRKGDLIFTGTNNTLVFETGPAWRKFLLHLFYAPPPDDVYTEGFACDMVAWSWNQRVPKDGPIAIVVDVDSSSLLNKPSKGETHNIQCGKDGEEGCGMDYYAVRDIWEGEEILCHYSDFANPRWHTFGL